MLSPQVHNAMALSAIRAVVGKGDIFHLLADLIDRPTTTRHGKFRTKYGRQTPCCEVCGYSIGDMRWGYCPKCGAVIIDD
nr:MAG TPA: hydrogenase/urease nickel incorporation protein [Caudoviricetes sp.]